MCEGIGRGEGGCRWEGAIKGAASGEGALGEGSVWPLAMGAAVVESGQQTGLGGKWGPGKGRSCRGSARVSFFQAAFILGHANQGWLSVADACTKAENIGGF